MRKHTIALVGGLVVLAGACKDNPAAPSTDRVVAGSPQTLQTLITGVTAADRSAVGGSYYTYGNIMARSTLVVSPNDPRITTEFFQTQPDPSDFVGGAQWNGYYQAIRAAQVLRKDNAFTSLSATDQAATAGFLQTLAAKDYLNVLDFHDTNGIVIQGPDPTVLDPILKPVNALPKIIALLDSAYTNFNTAGASSTVPFDVPSGYTLFGDYSQVGNLMAYNRGLKGEAEVYLALLNPSSPDLTAAAAAKTALDAALAGVTPSAATLKQGPYYEYTQDTPDNFGNPMVDVNNLLTVNFVNSIDPADKRNAKIIPATALTSQAYTSAPNRIAVTDPTNTANLKAPLPIRRNAQLYLLRAQAEIALGDLPAATADINVVHTIEGGLPAYSTFTSASAAIQAVLYEYRYSFILEGPQYLVALRQYGLLDQSYVSQPGIPTPGPTKDALVQRLPIPQNEANARGGNVQPQ